MDIIVDAHSRIYSYINDKIKPLLTASFFRYVTPNMVTYFRVLLIIPTIYLISYNYNMAAALLIIINDFLDFFDGILARYHAELGIIYDAVYGSFIDAFADKVFNVMLWIYLLCSSHVTNLLIIYLLYTIITIEIILGIIRIQSYKNGLVLHADMYGKTKQTLETIGSSLFIVNISYYAGVILLILSVYYSLVSLYNKIYKWCSKEIELFNNMFL